MSHIPNNTTPKQSQKYLQPKPASYQPINRQWQTSHRTTSDFRAEKSSPMARWEKEASCDQPWHAIGEIFVGAGVNHQSTNIMDREKQGDKSEGAVEGSSSSYTYVNHGMLAQTRIRHFFQD